MKNKSDEELALLYQETKDEEVFNELYCRFQRMIYKFYNKNVRKGFLEKDEILSACNYGFYKGVTSYKKNKKSCLSTVIYMWITSTIQDVYKSYNTHKKELETKRCVSIYKELGKNSDNSPRTIMDTLLLKDCDEYFKNQFVNIKDGIEYGLSKISNQQVKPYIIPILLGEFTMREVAGNLGLNKNTVKQHVDRFIKYFKSYSDRKALI